MAEDGFKPRVTPSQPPEDLTKIIVSSTASSSRSMPEKDGDILNLSETTTTAKRGSEEKEDDLPKIRRSTVSPHQQQQQQQQPQQQQQLGKTPLEKREHRPSNGENEFHLGKAGHQKGSSHEFPNQQKRPSSDLPDISDEFSSKPLSREISDHPPIPQGTRNIFEPPTKSSKEAKEPTASNVPPSVLPREKTRKPKEGRDPFPAPEDQWHPPSEEEELFGTKTSGLHKEGIGGMPTTPDMLLGKDGGGGLIELPGDGLRPPQFEEPILRESSSSHPWWPLPGMEGMGRPHKQEEDVAPPEHFEMLTPPTPFDRETTRAKLPMVPLEEGHGKMPFDSFRSHESKEDRTEPKLKTDSPKGIHSLETGTPALNTVTRPSDEKERIVPSTQDFPLPPEGMPWFYGDGKNPFGLPQPK